MEVQSTESTVLILSRWNPFVVVVVGVVVELVDFVVVIVKVVDFGVVIVDVVDFVVVTTVEGIVVEVVDFRVVVVVVEEFVGRRPKIIPSAIPETTIMLANDKMAILFTEK